MQELFRCERCGLTTPFKHWDGGLIDHENETSSWNLEVYLSRDGVDGLARLPKTSNEIFRSRVFKCRRIWVKESHSELLKQFDKLVAENMNGYKFFDPGI